MFLLAKYLLKRFLYSVLTLAAVSTATFFLMHLIPGGPFLGEKNLPFAVRHNLEIRFGLNRSLFVQYIAYFRNALSGNFGVSIRQPGRTVANIITTSFPVSFRLGIAALSVSLIAGILLGILAAIKKGMANVTVSVAAAVGMSVPSFIVASAGIILFGVTIPILPTYGLENWQSYLLPVFSLSLFPLAFTAKLMRSSMLEVVKREYIQADRARGIKESSIIFRHAMKSAIVPVITYFGPLTAGLLTGSFAIEKIFTIPGLGKYFVDSISDCDYPVILGTTIFYSALLIFMNFITDMLCAMLDPRLRSALKSK